MTDSKVEHPLNRRLCFGIVAGAQSRIREQLIRGDIIGPLLANTFGFGERSRVVLLLQQTLHARLAWLKVVPLCGKQNSCCHCNNRDGSHGCKRGRGARCSAASVLLRTRRAASGGAAWFGGIDVSSIPT